MTTLDFLKHERALPHGGKGNVVQWHVFRSPEEAESFAHTIQLTDEQHLVGGYSRDSIGPLWWVGVAVDDLERWGNRGAINKGVHIE